MAKETWNIEYLPAFSSRTKAEIEALWTSELPSSRDANPALWDTLIGFFEDAVVEVCRRPGCLVITPREVLKLMKHSGREPACGMAVITELFRKGDIVRADTLKVQEKGSSKPTGSLASLKATIGSYFWTPKAPNPPSLEDAIVPTAALSSVAKKASALLGPMATSEIHTLKSFAGKITAGNERDAEAVISHLVSQDNASVLYTDPTPENPVPTFGVRLGKGMPSKSDKGLLQTKAALERMQDLSQHLESQIASEKQAAVTLAKSGNKPEALQRLQKKAVLEKKLAGSRAAMLKLSDVLMAVDEAESNKEAVLALETGMESLKHATEGGVTADQVDSVAANFDEMLAQQQDVRVALQQLNAGSAAEDAQLEAELEAILEEDAFESMQHPELAAPESVPVPLKQSEPANAARAAELELEKLMREAAIEENSETDVTQLKTAAKVVEEDTALAEEAESSASKNRIVAPL